MVWGVRCGYHGEGSGDNGGGWKWAYSRMEVMTSAPQCGRLSHPDKTGIVQIVDDNF